ncbi:histidinol-phosphatase [Endozoicomonadaceae bacterium StTr2]
MALAIFDLDNTLIAGDSDYLWGKFLTEHELVDVQAYREGNEKFYGQYERGALDIDAYLEFCLAPLAANDMETLAGWHQSFMAEKIRPIMLEKAKALIAHHQQKGDTLLVITATNGFITGPIVAEFGIDHMLAIDAEIKDGRYTGQYVGIPTYQQGKVTRLDQWLQQHPQHNLTGSYFYSDSHNDVPLLEKVTYPIVVDPDQKLEETARERGWEVISLR